MIKQALFFTLFLLTLPTMAGPSSSPAVTGLKAMTPIIDVRTEQEYRQEHVQSAVNIPYEQITDRIAAVIPDRNTRIVLYCRSGRRSGIAEQALRKMGYTQIENKGGLDDMRRSGYQTE